MIKKQRIKAIGLLSGGLDSSLAAKLMIEQKIDVYALNFTSPLCLCNREGRCESYDIAEKLKIPLKIMAKGDDYAKIVKKPKHGYGKHANPCIDCRIYAFKKAKEYMKEIGAKFIFTGEVLNQRPMSQHKQALMLIEKESSLKGLVVRPLSGKLLPATIPEKKGWIKRKKMLDIEGRRRIKQIELAKNLNWKDYHCPSGGCLLTYDEFSKKVKDLVKKEKELTMKDLALLKYGRHFRCGRNKIIIGRDDKENKLLAKMRNEKDYLFEAEKIMGPTTILQGPKNKKAIETAAKLTARYGDAKKKKVKILYGQELNKKITVEKAKEKEIEKLRIK